MGATTTRLTFEEFERLPDQPGKRELLKGELIELPPAGKKHNRIAHNILFRLRAALQAIQQRGEECEVAEVRLEMGYLLCADVWVIPDVSGAFRDESDEEYLVGAPALAIEVVSPSNSAEDLATKTELYFQYGSREVWLVYPKASQVMVYTAGVPRIVRAGEAISTPLLPGLALSVSEILDESQL